MPAKNNATWKTKSIWPEIRSTLDSNDTIVVYDIESSGFSRKNGRIIEIGAIKYHIEPEYSLTEIDTYHSYVNPGQTLKPAITELTGITDEMLASAPAEEEIFEAVRTFFDGCLVGGYNIVNFDNKFFNEYYGRMGTTFAPIGSVDCLKIARNLLVKDDDVENYKLTTIGAYFGLQFQAHSALDDARTTGNILQMFIREYLQLEAAPTAVVSGTVQPLIQRIAFWEGFKGFSRIYVTTDAGTVYYDIRSHSWGGKDIDIREVDMAWLESEVFDILDITTEKEFAQFKGALDVA